MKTAMILALAIATSACGGDDGGSTKPPPPPGSAPAGGGAPAGAAAPAVKGKPLTPMTHIEQRINCPVPQKPTDKLPTANERCDPNAPVPCPTKAKPYCLNVPMMNDNYCFACPDRDSIRHAFRDRDFAPDPNQNRDPFQSFILTAQGEGSADKPVIDAQTQPQCNEKNSFAGSYSFQDLKLVGLVTQGTQRKALMAAGRSSYILKRNDCVGKEKALVKEVGDGFLTFVTQPDPNAKGAKAIEFSQQLHTELALGTQVESPPDSAPAANVPPPATTVPPPATTVPPPGGAKPKKLVPIPGPAPKPVPVPTPAPTAIKP